MAFSVLLGTAMLAVIPSGLSAAESPELARVEAIPNSAQKRVILTPEAAERIAIEMQPVREEQVKRWLLVDGEVEAAPGHASSQPATSDAATPSLIPVRVRVPRLDDPETIARQAFLAVAGQAQGQQAGSAGLRERRAR